MVVGRSVAWQPATVEGTCASPRKERKREKEGIKREGGRGKERRERERLVCGTHRCDGHAERSPQLITQIPRLLLLQAGLKLLALREGGREDGTRGREREREGGREGERGRDNREQIGQVTSGAML